MQLLVVGLLGCQQLLGLLVVFLQGDDFLFHRQGLFQQLFAMFKVVLVFGIKGRVALAQFRDEVAFLSGLFLLVGKLFF